MNSQILEPGRPARRAASTGVRRQYGLPGLLACLLTCIFLAPGSLLAASALTGMDFAALPGESVQLVFTTSGPAAQPRSFSTDNPARIALDFEGMTSELDRKSVNVGVGNVRSVSAVEAGGRTRVVVNLVNASPYDIRVVDNQVVLTVAGRGGDLEGAAAGMAAAGQAGSAPAARPGERAIENVDFRRGSAGEGRVVVTVSDPNAVIDMQEQGGRLLVDFMDTRLPERFMRRFDVTDFATPITSFEIRPAGANTRMIIQPTGEYEHLAYQADDQFTVEVRPLTPQEKEELEKRKKVFTGERLSLNFQDIEVRSVLQLLADFTGLNMVVSDTVGGNITLRLKNVPWDQAMDIILKTKGLSMRQTGNVILVAPTEEIAAREKLELESQKQIEELAPLRSEYVQINYAKAMDLAALLKSKDNKLLSDRGNVTVDERTNTLLVQDTEANLEDIRRLIQKLDVPVRQVLIESRVVIASDDFSRDLGVRFGLNRSNTFDKDDEILIAGGLPGSISDTASVNTGPFLQDVESGLPFNSAIEVEGGDASNAAGLMVNLPAPSAAGAVNFLIGRVGSYLLQLELSAAEQEGKAEVISSPRVITANQNTAVIKSGVEVPFQEATSSGATNVEFKEAVLQLEVTPQITPDDRVFLELLVKKDAPDFGRAVLGTPPIDTRSVETAVLVDNGETVVLGGIFEQTKSDDYDKVPFFADLPAVGNLFKSHSVRNNNSELLVFVTPKILKETFGLR
ncbi:MAG: type IV pilus secretin PilQ [Chromatiales bacterium]|jgi:type IV pilus assembly protein PilQ